MYRLKKISQSLLKRAVNEVDFSIFIILAYLLCYLLAKYSPVNILFLPGLILLFYLPGNLFFRLFPGLSRPWSGYGKLALEVFVSVSFVATVQIITAPLIDLTPKAQLIMLFGGVGFLYILTLLFKRPSTLASWIAHIRKEIAQTSINDYLVLGILLAVILIAYSVNPIANNADNFLVYLRDSINFGTNLSSLRPMFISYLAMAYYALGLPYMFIYRTLFVFLFFISTLIFFDYSKIHLKSRIFKILGYLVLLGAPVIISEANIIRPQVAMIAYTLPILLLSIESIRAKDFKPGLLALWFSLTALSFHELALGLILISLAALIYVFVALLSSDRKITWKQILVALIIILPYFKILPIFNYFQQAISMFKYAEGKFPGIHFRWWFINSYITVDGVNLGWPGTQAIYYYLYNGILLFIFALALGIWFLIKNQRRRFYFFIPIFYILIFLFIAEILPRLGLFFLPNRAWVHLMLGVYVFILLCFEALDGKIKDFPKLFFTALAGIILIGAVGIIYVSSDSISDIYRSELSAAKFIKTKTPQNSVFVSTQDNETLASVYGERFFARMEVDRKINQEEFNSLVNQKVKELSVKQIKIISPEIKEIIEKYSEGELISEMSKTIQKRRALEIGPFDPNTTPLYFIYSLRKSSGLNVQRDYLKKQIDIVNKDTYLSFNYPITYQDRSVIILKLR